MSDYFGERFTDIRQRSSTEVTNEILSQIAKDLLDRLTESGFAAGGEYLANCITLRDFPAIVRYDLDVLHLGPSDQYLLRQVVALFGKRQDFDIGVDTEGAARAKARVARGLCAATNYMFRLHEAGRFQFRPAVEAVLHSAQRKIEKMLHTVCPDGPPSLEEIRMRFGPGASTSVQKRRACLAVKLSTVPSCSTNFPDFLQERVLATSALSVLGTDERECTVSVHHAKSAFVPKTAKEKRGIRTEPSLNGMLQLGVGDLLSDALRTVGIDIRDQSANQRAALYGSVSGFLATLDLSSASDTVAIQLVRHLFPDAWYNLLFALRSESYVDQGEVVIEPGFSSMGNGFTFPLETIIFWALARSAQEIADPRSKRRVLVYGDDIIVTSRAAPFLADVLHDLGFLLNTKKSFWSGTFRESCGKDYVSGNLVRPVYVDNALEALDIFRLHNFFYRAGDFRIASLLKKTLSKDLRCSGPDGFGDGHFIGAYVPKRSKGIKAKGFSGFNFTTWRKEPVELEMSGFRTTRTKHGLRHVGDSKFWVLSRKIATYLAYLRPVETDMLRYLDEPVKANALTIPLTEDSEIFQVTRTQIYMFEPMVV